MDEDLKNNKQYRNYILVGRPNVGKSSIFNFLVGKHEAFVKDEDGTTIDWRSKRIGKSVFWDTPGVFKISKMPPCEIGKFDKIFLVIENNVLDYDKKLYIELKKNYKNVFVIVNKIDLNNKNHYENYDLFDDYIGISLKTRIGLEKLKKLFDIDLSGKNSKSENEQSENYGDKKIWAIIGKPNVGKSSIINFLAQKEIHKVEDYEGTTKELLPVEIDDKIMLDTPGQRRRAIFPHYSKVFGIVFIIDLKQERQDLRLIGLMSERRKPIIIVINKIDLDRENKRIKIVEESIRKFWDIPIIKISCKEGRNLDQIPKMIRIQEENYSKRIKTSELNSWLKNEISKIEPRLKFITQIETDPPKFYVDFQLEEHKERMLKNRISKKFGFSGIPILIKYSQKKDE